MNVKFSIQKRLSSKTGNAYVCLVATTHYGERVIFLKSREDYMFLLNFTPSELDALEVGQIINLTKGE